MFRAYTDADVIGVELCGALKNIVALGAGAIDGMGYGDNAKAGFMTRGLAEIARYGFACGANPLTVAGLAGVGDLIATCISKHSRNRTVGELLATGSTKDIRGPRWPGRGGERGRGDASRGRGEEVSMPITEQTQLPPRASDPPGDATTSERGEEIAARAEISRLSRGCRARQADRRFQRMRPRSGPARSSWRPPARRSCHRPRPARSPHPPARRSCACSSPGQTGQLAGAQVCASRARRRNARRRPDGTATPVGPPGTYFVRVSGPAEQRWRRRRE
jgi:hypothetical protein